MGDFDIAGVGRGTRYRDDDEPPSPGGVTPDTRTTDRLASERADDFFANGATAGIGQTLHDFFLCGNPAHYKTYDYDGCGVDPDLGNPVLFLQQAHDADPVNLHDVKQGNLGDCYVMAVLAALTLSPEGRALIKGAIAEGKDAEGVTYTVTLHPPTRDPSNPGSATDLKVTVPADYANGHATPRTGQGGKNPEVWPLVIERAYAAFMGGYNAIGRGGRPNVAMEILTGKPATRIELWTQFEPSPCGADFPGTPLTPYSEQDLERDIAAGKLLVLETKPDVGDHHRLRDNHAYVVTGTEKEGGRLFLTLHNPWDSSEPQRVPFDELQNWFSAIDIGSVK